MLALAPISVVLNHFDNLNLPSVVADQSSLLGSDISAAEILAIKSLKCNKPPGYISEFYKKFATEICPLLKAMFNELLSSGHLPPTLRQTSITLLPKGGKDHLQCASYCPISLLNVDYKISSKVLAMKYGENSPTNNFIGPNRLHTNYLYMLMILFYMFQTH